MSPSLLCRRAESAKYAATVLQALHLHPETRSRWIDLGRVILRRRYAASRVVPEIERIYTNATILPQRGEA